MKKLLVTISWVFLVSVQPVLSAELTILTENLPPLNYVEGGILVGPSVEIVKEIQRRVGSFEQIQVYPWARAYKMALEKENVILFGMTYTKVRQDKFIWVGPLATKRDILVAKKESGIKINSLDDAKRVYSEKVIDHFLYPRNAGGMKEADGFARTNGNGADDRWGKGILRDAHGGIRSLRLRYGPVSLLNAI